MNIAVIGAGYGGLSAAYDLARAGHDVVVYEAADRAGGLAVGFKEPHWEWSVEAYYHHWFASDEHMLGLIEELGLGDKVRFPRPFTVMLHKGKWYPFDSIIQALLYPGLGWGINKVRFGLVGLYLRLTQNWQAMEKTTVDAWMRKWAGNKVYETMLEPMLKVQWIWWRKLLRKRQGQYYRPHTFQVQQSGIITFRHPGNHPGQQSRRGRHQHSIVGLTSLCRPDLHSGRYFLYRILKPDLHSQIL